MYTAGSATGAFGLVVPINDSVTTLAAAAATISLTIKACTAVDLMIAFSA